VLIPKAACSKALVCSRSFPVIVGSNAARCMDVCLMLVLCLPVRGLSVGLIFRIEKFYRVWCVCDCKASIMRKPWPTRGCCAIENNRFWVSIIYYRLLCIYVTADRYNHELLQGILPRPFTYSYRKPTIGVLPSGDSTLYYATEALLFFSATLSISQRTEVVVAFTVWVKRHSTLKSLFCKPVWRTEYHIYSHRNGSRAGIPISYSLFGMVYNFMQPSIFIKKSLLLQTDRQTHKQACTRGHVRARAHTYTHTHTHTHTQTSLYYVHVFVYWLIISVTSLIVSKLRQRLSQVMKYWLVYIHVLQVSFYRSTIT
jgi:hypothetical protein